MSSLSYEVSMLPEKHGQRVALSTLLFFSDNGTVNGRARREGTLRRFSGEKLYSTRLHSYNYLFNTNLYFHIAQNIF